MPEETPDPGNFYARLASSISAEERRFLREEHATFTRESRHFRAPLTRQELRAQSAREYGLLMNAITNARARAVTQGHEPNEVLLGPQQIRVLQIELRFQIDEGTFRVPDVYQPTDLLREDMGSNIINGLRIRAMKQDGVLVAITFSSGGD